MRTVVIGTRGSALSLCQTQLIQVKLEERFPGQRFVQRPIKAKADAQPDVPLVAMSGEGIFVKELEEALLQGEVDLAVHSMKDLPLAIPSSLILAAVLEREDARDVLVLRQAHLVPTSSRRDSARGSTALGARQDERHQRTQGALMSRSGQSFAELPAGSRVGTSSLRRRSQLLFARRDLEMMDIRGNVDTRLRKLDEGRYDAIVLAAAGLIRLGLKERITQYLSLDEMLPEPGQGALGLEAREEDAKICEMLSAIDDPTTRACVDAERSLLRVLGGGCRVPIAAYAHISEETLTLEGAVIAPDGSRCLRGRVGGPVTSSVSLGETLGQRLIGQGARELLERHQVARQP